MPAMPAKAAAINRSFLLMFQPPLVLFPRRFLFWYPSTGFSPPCLIGRSAMFRASFRALLV
jgi:hypothetical protein